METGTNWQPDSQPINQQEIPIPQLPPQGMGNTQGISGQGMGYGNIVPPQKKNHTKVWITLGVILAVVMVAGTTAAAVLLNSPKYIVAKAGASLLQEIEQVQIPADSQPDWAGVAQMLGEEGGHTKNRWNVSSDVFAEWLGQSITLGVDMDSYLDKKTKQMSGNVALSVMNNNLLDMDIYAEQDTICFSIPALFLEDMYFSSQNIVSQYNRSLWADYHRLDSEDFSIDLFQTYSYMDREQFTQNYAEELAALSQKISLEKVEKGLYRITLPQAETEALLQAVAEMEDLQQEIPCQQFLQDEVKLLLELDGNKRIESIVLEEPVAILDGKDTLEGEVFFLGEKRSIDKVQGKIIVTEDGEEALRLVVQLIPTAEDTTYGMEASVKCTSNGQLSRIDYQREYDSDRAKFQIEATVDTQEETVAVQTEGTFEDVAAENTLHLNLEELTVSMDGKDLYKISGELLVEPLQEEVVRTVEARTDFFAMTEQDWEEIALQVINKYGTLWDALQ